MKKKCSTCKYAGRSDTACYCSLCSGYNGWEAITCLREEPADARTNQWYKEEI